MPEGVTELAGAVFHGADGLKSVSLPSTLQSIGDSAFRGSGLETVALPDSLNFIGRYAYENCTALQSVEFGSGLKEIGFMAFSGCTALTEANLPDSLEALNGYAFRNCVSLHNIHYPVNLKKAGGEDFAGCTALESVTVPEGVTELAGLVFDGANALKYVNLPSTLLSIGDSAFRHSGLVYIDLPDGVSEIGKYAFTGCKRLQKIDFGSGLKHIGYSAFSDCDALVEVLLPNSVTDSDSLLFYGCDRLETVVLSDAMQTVETEIFLRCPNLKSVHLPAQLKEISYAAFRGCTALTELYIPDSVTRISDTAFQDVPDLTFLCSLCSYAAEYALDRQIPIVPIQVNGEADAQLLNRGGSYYIHNYDGISAAGLMSMVVRYELAEDAQITPTGITIHIYDYAALQEHTLTLDGVLCTDYEYDEDTGRLTVAVNKTSGILRFCLKPLRYETLTSYARLIYKDADGREKVEVIGAVNSLMPALNISAREETSKSSVFVSGVAVPETEVALYVDGSLVTTVRSNKAGDYSADISLGTLCDGKKYIVTAKATDKAGNPAEATTEVTYREEAPELVDFTLIYNRQTLSLEEMKTKRNILLMGHWQTFRCEIEFTNPESLDAVFVISTRNNVKKYIQAFWDPELGKFVAEGYFDPNDHNYVPGVLTLEYIIKGQKQSFYELMDFSSQENYQQLTDYWKNAEITVLENTDDCLTMEMEVVHDGITRQLNITNGQRPIPEGITEEWAIKNGYTPQTDDYGNTVYYKYHEKPDEVEMEFLDFTTGILYNLMVNDSGYNTLVDEAFGGPVTTVLEVLTTMLDAKTTDQKYSEMADFIQRNPGLDAQTRKEALITLSVAKGINTTTTVLKLACIAVGFAGSVVLTGGAALGVAVGTILVTALLDKVREKTDYYVDNMMYHLGLGVRWAIDPSGYVYDKLTGARLEGVTVHAFWVENTGEDPDFWDKKPADTEYGVLWDSVEFSQRNPLVTDGDGRYAWDVPEGWWRVSYEKDGYESAWSEWLPVPPPQTEVNIGLMPLYVPHEHTWSDWEITAQPNYLENGEETRICTGCSETENREIPNNPFPDVGAGNSFKTYILWNYYEGIIGGDKQGNFNPDKTVTRGQFIIMLWRAAGKPEPNQHKAFPDVSENSSFYKAVCWAVEKGITNGKKDGNFGVNDPCTRGHVALFLYRYAEEPKVNSNVSFPDVTGGTYYKAVCWLVEEGITNGQKDGTFGVSNACKRTHVTKFLFVYCTEAVHP